jgi:hypothetical protein
MHFQAFLLSETTKHVHKILLDIRLLEYLKFSKLPHIEITFTSEGIRV